MQNPVIMRVLNGASHLRHQRDAPARLIAKGRTRVEQTAAGRKFHAEKREAVFAFAHFIDWQYVRMIETRGSLRFATKTREGLSRIAVVTQNTFQRDDSARVSLPRAVNYSHPAASDFLKNLIVAESPIGIGYVDLSEYAP